MSLVDNQLRTRNMVTMLNALGIKLDETKVTCKGDSILFNSGTKEGTIAMVVELQALLQKDDIKPKVRTVTFAQLVAEEIERATSDDPMMAAINKSYCTATLKALETVGQQYTIDEELQSVSLILPKNVHSSVFQSLKYKHLSIEGDTIKFNFAAYLKEHQDELVLVDDKNPLLFAHSNAFKSKKVFYAKKKISEDTFEVTPYFCVPDALTPPHYHFVLDTSGSMDNNIQKMKESVIKFADAIFDFQPEAVISINDFNTKSNPVQSFRKGDFSKLCEFVNSLISTGQTALYHATWAKIESLALGTHNNVLLLSDGGNSTQGDDVPLLKLLDDITKGHPLIAAQNKIVVLSYNTTQTGIMKKVTDTFHSEVIDTKTIDFEKALSDKGALQQWAAARDLLSCGFGVEGDFGAESSFTVVQSPYNLSGQIAALEPKRIKVGDTVSLVVTNGNGKTVLEDKQTFGKKPAEASIAPGSAAAAATLGIMAAPRPLQTVLDVPAGAPGLGLI